MTRKKTTYYRCKMCGTFGPLDMGEDPPGVIECDCGNLAPIEYTTTQEAEDPEPPEFEGVPI
jgi:hypothetical protein